MKRFSNLFAIAGAIVLSLSAFFFIFYIQYKNYALIGFAVASVFLISYGVINRHKVWDVLKWRSTRYRINISVIIILILTIITLIEIISYQNNKIFDLTPAKRYTLSPQTQKILKSLNKKVKVILFYGRETLDLLYYFEKIFKQYAYYTPLFSFSSFDVDRNPGIAQTYNIKRYGTLVVECGDKRREVGLNNEEAIISAILSITREKQKLVCFLTGHGENTILSRDRDGYSQIRDKLENENYNVKELFLLNKGELPLDTQVLVISGPKKDLLQEEIEKISCYMIEGGGVIFMIEPHTFVPNLAAFIARYNLTLGKGIIIDKENQQIRGDWFMALVPLYKRHPIVERLNMPNIFPTARPIIMKEGLSNGFVTEIIAKTSPLSWAKETEGMADQHEPSFEKGKDVRGPIGVAAVVTLNQESTRSTEKISQMGATHLDKKKTPPGRMVVFGDSDFGKNAFVDLDANRDLLLNTIDWLAGEKELISLRPKIKEGVEKMITAPQAKRIFWICVIIQPGVILLLGLIVILIGRRTG